MKGGEWLILIAVGLALLAALLLASASPSFIPLGALEERWVECASREPGWRKWRT